ncbi:hypothetical protein DdX_06886 [Ditylenchus destructor]|uniref:Uncharacterized protein n=1 Tax=Ditylenchus destructor TaxID=166010 RepID=A0AAD4N4S6_9BILA|nr:hypothetical protein DdX_06886 [Ditylenchus destructor]
MEEGDINKIACLMDWLQYDKVMGRVLYDTFGKLLEEKVRNLQDRKREIKDAINENCGPTKLPSTPKRFTPMTSLLDQIQKMRTISLEVEVKPSTRNMQFKRVPPAKRVLTFPFSADSEESKVKFPARETVAQRFLIKQDEDAKDVSEMDHDGDSHKEVIQDTPTATLKTKHFNGTVVEETPNATLKTKHFNGTVVEETPNATLKTSTSNSTLVT